MADKLLTTLPGDILGLLRRGSPAWGSPFTNERRSCVIVALDADMATINYGENLVPVPTASLMLDLTDPTGRVHAAWWVRGWISSRGGWAGLTTATLDLLVAVCDGHPMTSAQIDALARLVLRLAGRGA